MGTPIIADVLIIGGGPAGTSAALTCARAGLSVVLLEALPFPRHRPGETLHPGVEPLFQRLGVADSVDDAGFLRPAGIWVERLGSREFLPYGADSNGPWRGFQACRAHFDALLLDAARAAGVAVYQPHRALSILRQGHRVVGAETTLGPIQARFTLDATGRVRWLARQRALPIRRASPRLVALYGYMQGDCSARDAAPLFAERLDGWVWTACIRPRHYHWTRLVTTAAPLDRAWIPTEFVGLKPLGAPRGADVTWRLVEACAGPGYFVLGDAAAITDPSSSHGVLRAIMSGMLAGHLVARGAPEAEVGQEYQHFLHSWFASDRSRLAVPGS